MILREAILSGEVGAGHELSLTDTAENLRVSRTPVREAFQLLESEGLLELRMNRGAVVKPINRKFIADHFDMRSMLEGEAVYRAIKNNMPTDALRTLQDEISRMDEIPDDVYDDYNARFHQAFWYAAGNDRLFSFLDTLWNGPTYSHTSGKQVEHGKSVVEHGLILESAEAHDAEKARAVMQKHIERSMRIILASKISSPE